MKKISFSILLFHIFLSNSSFQKIDNKKVIILFEDSVDLNYVNEFNEIEFISGKKNSINGKKYFQYETEFIKFLYFLDLKNNKLSSFFTFPGDTMVIEEDLKGYLTVKSLKFSGELQLLNYLDSENLNFLFTSVRETEIILNFFLEKIQAGVLRLLLIR
jgi:hypothetical protein